MDIKRLRELAGNSQTKIIGYHASDKAAITSILSHGFVERNNSIWFNTDPNIGIDDGDSYIIRAALSMKNPWRYGDTNDDFDPDSHHDILQMIALGYDAWIGESNVGVGDDVVVFSARQVCNIQYYGHRVIIDGHKVVYQR